MLGTAHTPAVHMSSRLAATGGTRVRLRPSLVPMLADRSTLNMSFLWFERPPCVMSCYGVGKNGLGRRVELTDQQRSGRGPPASKQAAVECLGRQSQNWLLKTHGF